jgi:hypothetical protein
MASPTQRIDQHPDIVAMRMPYERVAESSATQITEGLAFLAGLYLAVSPWVVGFSGLPTITLNNLFTGIAAALLALGYASAFGRTHGLSWVLPVLGAWTIVSPWAVSGDVSVAPVIISNVIVGSVILLLGLVTVAVGMRRTGERRAERY